MIVHLITSSSPTNLSLTVLETAAVFQLPGWFPALRAHLVLAPSLRDDTEEVLQTPTSRCRVRGDMAAVCLCAFMFKWPALACPNRPQHAESTRGGILDMAEHPHPLRWSVTSTWLIWILWTIQMTVYPSSCLPQVLMLFYLLKWACVWLACPICFGGKCQHHMSCCIILKWQLYGAGPCAVWPPWPLLQMGTSELRSVALVSNSELKVNIAGLELQSPWNCSALTYLGCTIWIDLNSDHLRL